MRLTVMIQTAQGLNKKNTEFDTDIPTEFRRIKWYLWHGNVFRALQLLEYLSENITIGKF